jgi:uncharacterized damage-inducible protein DinB
MKSTDTLTTLFNHHLWANLRLLEQCAALTSEQLHTSVPGSYGVIYDTLQHIVTAEQGYFSRISAGQPSQKRPADAPPLTMDEMAESLRTTGAGLIEWALKVQAEDAVPGARGEVPKTIILTQAINHATEHREQIKACLTALGIEPLDVSSWTYFDETAS